MKKVKSSKLARCGTKAMSYFNIHRHSPAKDLEETAIINVFPEQEVPEKQLYSVGFHPWHLSENMLECGLELVKGKSENAIAIGECGLDRACDVPFGLQTKAFRAQIEIATILGKPLIIHCVRAYSELISERNSSRSVLPWIVHGFRGNSETAAQLIAHGLYLSFGEALMKDVRLGEILATVPEDRFFLETDESRMGISEIYARAAALRKTDVEEIIKRQWKNASAVFGSGNLSGY